MFPNNDEIMYRFSRMRAKEIRDDVAAARTDQTRSHILRRRITVLAGLALVGLTAVLMTLALGWWVL